jgi:hypothetical protein
MKNWLRGLQQFLTHPFFAGLLTFVVLLKLMTPLISPTTCRDGWPSQSIGQRGACSHHGGLGTNWSFFGVFFASGAGAATVARVMVVLARRRRAEYERMHQAKVAAANVQQYKEPLRKPSTPACPLCGATMRVRLAKKGRHSGEEFWGCSDYPRCRGIRPYTQAVSGSNSRRNLKPERDES